MPRMLDLRNVFQPVDDTFNNRALCEHQTVIERHQSLFHVALELSQREFGLSGGEEIMVKRNGRFLRLVTISN